MIAPIPARIPVRIIPAAICLATLATLYIPAPAQTAGTGQTAPDSAAQAKSMADQPYSSLAARIADLLADPSVARDHWGIMVTALDGAQIYALNEAQLLQPASNAKLFTTSAALALLGPT